MLMKTQVEPPVQGIDAHSKDLGRDIKSFARVTAVVETVLNDRGPLASASPGMGGAVEGDQG